MVALLDHENVDIALAAVDLIHELTDPEALTEAEEEDGAKVSLPRFPRRLCAARARVCCQTVARPGR